MTNNSKLKPFLPIIFSFLLFFSGIIRHDVDVLRYLELAKQSQFDCVGQIVIKGKNSGSCVLINKKYVLTAAHVLIETKTKPQKIKYNGFEAIAYVPISESVVDFKSIKIKFGTTELAVKNTTIHPNYLDSLTKGSCDLAILELDSNILNINVAALNPLFDELHSNVVGVGFGANGIANLPETVRMNNLKIAGENVIDSLTGSSYMNHKTLLLCDFDHPNKRELNKSGDFIPRPLEYISSGGDSGGGLFRTNGKSWELIGICSVSKLDIEQINKSGYYGQTMEWIRVSVFKNWISEQLK